MALLPPPQLLLRVAALVVVRRARHRRAARRRLTLLGPALMLFFLLKVTGIPATEARALVSRADYAEYRRTTSAFVPWFPPPPVTGLATAA